MVGCRRAWWAAMRVPKSGSSGDGTAVATYVTADLGYIVEVERFSTKVAGSHEAAPVALRTTSIFRREDGAWKIVHRHADPITAARPPDSVVQK